MTKPRCFAFQTLFPCPYYCMSTTLLVYAGCISGAMQMEDYLALVPLAGFVKMAVQKKKPIIVPENVLLRL